ncbi:MAG: hypothetical protein ABH826_01655 [Patescibacteria group bacterium]|nr:hypothetical protein [Patescibacteria group bacterium]
MSDDDCEEEFELSAEELFLFDQLIDGFFVTARQMVLAKETSDKFRFMVGQQPVEGVMTSTLQMQTMEGIIGIFFQVLVSFNGKLTHLRFVLPLTDMEDEVTALEAAVSSLLHGKLADYDN